MKAHPRAAAEEILAHLKPFESGPQYRAIGPRHFEAAACKTVQIMYEDAFQGIFFPEKHYIPLRRDYANIEDVVRQLRDKEICERIAAAAYEDIVLNDRYRYSAFVQSFDRAVESLRRDTAPSCPTAK